jgi:hypothetical protein
VISEGTTPAGDPVAAAAAVRPWREAGATWWIEADWAQPREAVRDYAAERLAAGPPPEPPAEVPAERDDHLGKTG